MDLQMQSVAELNYQMSSKKEVKYQTTKSQMWDMNPRCPETEANKLWL